MDNPIEIRFGALSEPIRKQLAAQGIKANPSSAARWQKLADATVILQIHGILSGSTLINAQKKIYQRIISECKATASKHPAQKKSK